MTDKLTVIVEAFTPRQANTLRGFVVIVVPKLHLKIHDVSIHKKGDSRWCGLPSKPQIGCDDRIKRDGNGRAAYSPTMEFTDAKTPTAFSNKVIAALLEFAPSAFELDDEMEGAR